MKRSRFLMVAGASATMITIGWRVGMEPLPSLVVSEYPAGGAIVSDPAVNPTIPGSSSGTFVGDAVDTEWGTMQVQIVVSDGEIVDVQPLILGLDDSKSRQINNQAVPILEQRILDAQSAEVSYVSGASYTSEGYLDSVASAIDRAGI